MTNNTSGIVKWFNEGKGFGFIQSDSGEDLFAHYSKINMSGYKVLKKGQRVQFEITQGKKADKLAISQLCKATVLGC
ncbi:cold shock domain-containing protein [Acinetobacter sp. ANC 7200]|nr:cold shock domain-containing protein [Acinetobacter amyesii]MCL6243424.1 cold shock domain-containing protein [Acinetobacter amyesii]